MTFWKCICIGYIYDYIGSNFFNYIPCKTYIFWYGKHDALSHGKNLSWHLGTNIWHHHSIYNKNRIDNEPSWRVGPILINNWFIIFSFCQWFAPFPYRSLILFPVTMFEGIVWMFVYWSSPFCKSNDKGQLISECLLDVLNFPKKQRKNLTNFCPRI